MTNARIEALSDIERAEWEATYHLVWESAYSRAQPTYKPGRPPITLLVKQDIEFVHEHGGELNKYSVY